MRPPAPISQTSCAPAERSGRCRREHPARHVGHRLSDVLSPEGSDPEPADEKLQIHPDRAQHLSMGMPDNEGRWSHGIGSARRGTPGTAVGQGSGAPKDLAHRVAVPTGASHLSIPRSEPPSLLRRADQSFDLVPPSVGDRDARPMRRQTPKPQVLLKSRAATSFNTHTPTGKIRSVPSIAVEGRAMTSSTDTADKKLHAPEQNKNFNAPLSSLTKVPRAIRRRTLRRFTFQPYSRPYRDAMMMASSMLIRDGNVHARAVRRAIGVRGLSATAGLLLAPVVLFTILLAIFIDTPLGAAIALLILISAIAAIAVVAQATRSTSQATAMHTIESLADLLIMAGACGQPDRNSGRGNRSERQDQIRLKAGPRIRGLLGERSREKQLMWARSELLVDTWRIAQLQAKSNGLRDSECLDLEYSLEARILRWCGQRPALRMPKAVEVVAHLLADSTRSRVQNPEPRRRSLTWLDSWLLDQLPTLASPSHRTQLVTHIRQTVRNPALMTLIGALISATAIVVAAIIRN
jgi:hypothetical protein